MIYILILKPKDLEVLSNQDLDKIGEYKIVLSDSNRSEDEHTIVYSRYGSYGVNYMTLISEIIKELRDGDSVAFINGKDILQKDFFNHEFKRGVCYWAPVTGIIHHEIIRRTGVIPFTRDISKIESFSVRGDWDLKSTKDLPKILSKEGFVDYSLRGWILPGSLVRSIHSVVPTGRYYELEFLARVFSYNYAVEELGSVYYDRYAFNAFMNSENDSTGGYANIMISMEHLGCDLPFFRMIATLDLLEGLSKKRDARLNEAMSWARYHNINQIIGTTPKTSKVCENYFECVPFRKFYGDIGNSELNLELFKDKAGNMFSDYNVYDSVEEFKEKICLE